MASATGIQTAFQNVLGRAPSQGELDAYLSASQASSGSDSSLYATIVNSAEAHLTVDPVIRFYQAAFGRVPDRGGLDNASDYLHTHQPTAQTYQALAQIFTTSQEFTYRYGAGDSINADFVQALYQNVLGRAGSDAEVSTYVTGASGYTTRAQVLYAFAQSGEFIARADAAVNTLLTQAASDSVAYQGPLLPGVSINIGTSGGSSTSDSSSSGGSSTSSGGSSTSSGSTSSGSTSSGSTSGGGSSTPVPPQPVPLSQTLTLTTTAGESIAGGAGDDVINGMVSATAGVSTFNTGDIVDGAAGRDTFNITLSGDLSTAGTMPTATTVTNVEVVNLIHTDDTHLAGTSLLDLSNYPGIQQIWQTDNAAGGGTFVNVTVSAGVTAGFHSTGIAATAVAATVTVNGATATQALNVALDGVASGSSITFAAGNTGVETITGNVAGAGNLTINAGTAATELDVGLTSNGFITVAGAALTTVDFSSSTGNETANLTGLGANLTSLKGGLGRDTFSVQFQQNKALTIDMGAGNDTLVVTGVAGAAGTAAQSTVTLGTGKDIVQLGAVSNVSSATEVNFQRSMIVVTDFKTSEDVLNLNGAGKTLNASQLDTIKGAVSLFSAVQTAASAANGSDVVFSYGSDAYVLVDGANAGTFGVGDGLIKLVGVDATQFTNTQNGNFVL